MSDLQERPLVTFALFAYNQEQFIREAVEGALAQGYSPLEIILSDDCSDDRTFDFMKSLADQYEGPHKVRLNRTEKNLGLGGHINQVMGMVSGKLIVVAAGDDVSLPCRVERLVQKWIDSGAEIASLFSNVIEIDEDSNKKGQLRKSGEIFSLSPISIIQGSGGVMGCSQAWTRNIFEIFGPLNGAIFQEDVAIPFRAALAGTIIYVDEPLVLYRRHQYGLWSSTAYAKSKSESQRWHRKWARNLIFLQQGFRREVANYAEKVAINSVDMANLQTALKLRRWEAHVEYVLHKNTGFFRRANLILTGFIKGTSVRRISRWAIMTFVHGVYMRILAKGR